MIDTVSHILICRFVNHFRLGNCRRQLYVLLPRVHQKKRKDTAYAMKKKRKLNRWVSHYPKFHAVSSPHYKKWKSAFLQRLGMFPPIRLPKDSVLCYDWLKILMPLPHFVQDRLFKKKITRKRRGLATWANPAAEINSSTTWLNKNLPCTEQKPASFLKFIPGKETLSQASPLNLSVVYTPPDLYGIPAFKKAQWIAY